MITEYITDFSGNPEWIAGNPPYTTYTFRFPLYYGADFVQLNSTRISDDLSSTRTVDSADVKLFLYKDSRFGVTGHYFAKFVCSHVFLVILQSGSGDPSYQTATAVTSHDITYYYWETNFSADLFRLDVAPAVNEQDISSVKEQQLEPWVAAYLYYQSRVETDPYQLGGTSDVGGGTGTFSETGTDVDIPALPTLSATAAGFIRLYNPTLTQLNDLADYMWTGLFDLANFRKIFADPMDCILGLSIVPVAVLDAGSEEITVGNIGTGIYMNKAASQYVEVDCGSLDVKEYWGAYLDYDPFTKAEIYLPYIGTHALAVDDIMGKTVTVKYHIDILSGACVAYVKCGGTVLYSFNGQCSASIPVSKNDWTNVVNGVLSIAGSIGSMVATGGMSAPAAIPGIVSTASNSMKPSIEKSGSLSGTGGLLGIQTPYLILTRPRQAAPENQNGMMGYPSFVNRQLGDLTGYTEVEEIHLEGVPATDAELTEIVSLLKGGVIF